MENAVYTMGVDVGGSYVKVVLMKYEKLTNDHKLIDKQTEKIRKRNPKELVKEVVDTILKRNKLDYDKDIAYLASTGEGEMVERKTGQPQINMSGKMRDHARKHQWIRGPIRDATGT